MNLSVVIASCLNKPEREEYLYKSIESIRKYFGKDIEILIGFDKYGREIENTKCYIHDKGIGHSWNWGIKESKNEIILQTEDDWIMSNNDISFIMENFEKRIEVIKNNGGMFQLDFINGIRLDSWKDGFKEFNEFDYKFYELNKPSLPISWWTDYRAYYYSNHPQLKIKSFIEKVGKYLEFSPPHEVEVNMCQKYHKSGERVFFSKFDTFIHIGEIPSR